MIRTPNIFSVLIVDDNPEVLSLLKDYLREICDLVDTAKDASEALEKYAVTKYDLIITDLNMPGLSGIEFIKRIKRADNFTEFIIITGYASLDTAIDAVKLGAFDYIVKPFRLEELKVSVKNAKEKVLLKKLNTELFSKLQKLHSELDKFGPAEKCEDVSVPSSSSDTEHLVNEIRRLERLRTKLIRNSTQEE